MPRRFIFVSLLIGIAACDVVGPNYEPAPLGLEHTFVNGSETPSGQTSDLAWWQEYHDDQLSQLVERGFSQNLSIQAAMAAARAAKARAEATGLDSLQNPVTVSAARDRSELDIGGQSFNSSLSVNVSYVFDLFGRVQRTQEAAAAQFEAAQYQVGTARLAYLSAIVGAYVDMRFAQESLELTRQAIASQRSVYQIVVNQKKEGEASDLQLAQAQAALDRQRAQLPDFENTFRRSVFNIATLLDEPALPLLVALERGAPQPVPKSKRPLGVPADLLLNRPDIAVAERNFAAAVAKVGIAEAALYPSIALNGTIVDSSDALTFSLGPALSLPLLNRASLESSREAAMADAQQAQILWRESVTSAVGEVQSAQSSYKSALREAANLRKVVDSNERVLKLTREAYKEGDIALTDLITATQELNQSRAALALVTRQIASDWLQLQIASGAGWMVSPRIAAH